MQYFSTIVVGIMTAFALVGIIELPQIVRTAQKRVSR